MDRCLTARHPMLSPRGLCFSTQWNVRRTLSTLRQAWSGKSLQRILLIASSHLANVFATASLVQKLTHSKGFWVSTIAKQYFQARPKTVTEGYVTFRQRATSTWIRPKVPPTSHLWAGPSDCCSLNRSTTQAFRWLQEHVVIWTLYCWY